MSHKILFAVNKQGNVQPKTLKRGAAWEVTQGLNSLLLLYFIIITIIIIIIIIIMSHSQCFIGVRQKTVASQVCPRFAGLLQKAVDKLVNRRFQLPTRAHASQKISWVLLQRMDSRLMLLKCGNASQPSAAAQAAAARHCCLTLSRRPSPLHPMYLEIFSSAPWRMSFVSCMNKLIIWITVSQPCNFILLFRHKIWQPSLPMLDFSRLILFPYSAFAASFQHSGKFQLLSTWFLFFFATLRTVQDSYVGGSS